MERLLTLVTDPQIVLMALTTLGVAAWPNKVFKRPT